MYAVKVYEAYITTRLKEKRIIMNKKYLPGELALCIVLIINSLGVCLMAKSGFGISTISSVPFVFNKVFPALSFGPWNYIFQTMLVLTLMILKKAFCFEYVFPFVVGIGFGKMIDVHDAWLALLPNTMALNTVFCIGIFDYRLWNCTGESLYASDYSDGYISKGYVRDSEQTI